MRITNLSLSVRNADATRRQTAAKCLDTPANDHVTFWWVLITAYCDLVGKRVVRSRGPRDTQE